VRERQALRVESTPTSYRPSRPPARPSARPLSRASSLQCRSAPCRPLAPATRTVHGVSLAVPSERFDSMRSASQDGELCASDDLAGTLYQVQRSWLSPSLRSTHSHLACVGSTHSHLACVGSTHSHLACVSGTSLTLPQTNHSFGFAIDRLAWPPQPRRRVRRVRGRRGPLGRLVAHAQRRGHARSAVNGECGLTAAATSAPGLGSLLPHLRRDWAHAGHVSAGAGFTPASICSTPWPTPDICAGSGLTAAHLRRGIRASPGHRQRWWNGKAKEGPPRVAHSVAVPAASGPPRAQA
jgi:hypothetical protein